MTEFVSNIFFRIWYWYISKIDKKAEVIFMNYGYSKDSHEIDLEEADKINKYPVQLYDFVANSIDLNGKDLLEVGCGRGGGLSYINRYLKPKTATGIDLNNKAISFCQKNYKDITFLQGNAQLLKFENHSFDVVINVESSHRYAQVDKFLEEVHRVLRPGGHLIFTDFRLKNEIEKLNEQFVKEKLKVLKNELITTNVLEALRLSSAKTEDLVRRLTPKIVHSIGKKFAATEGTPTFKKFATNEYEYLFYVLTK